MSLPTVSVTHRDWSLHRQGPVDQKRHDDKVREAVKGSLHKIVGEEAIITGNDKQIVKVPIRSVYLPYFKHGNNDGNGVGQGEGGTGDAVGKAGNEPGVDYYETDITIEDLAALLFADLGLPFLQPKGKEQLVADTIEFSDVRRKGAISNLDKRRTIAENMRRNAMNGTPGFRDLTDDDLRYKTWEPKVVEENNAVVFAMRDVSGSMGEWEKYVTRSFYFWMVRFLRSKYSRVEIVFITHHTEAQEVAEKAFFDMGESGGTRVSSAYQLTHDLIKQRYPTSDWNIYPYHFSDGDNWGNEDNDRCVALVRDMLKTVNAFGYGEIKPQRSNMYPGSATTLMNAFEKITEPNFVRTTIASKEEVYPALKKFFATDGTLAA